ncbi:MAG: adenylosuccinate lyase, partial [Syntrophaceae bacterium]|nr:adenylosuccinate lyase [Syntrophaceae bacterium]
MIARYSREKMEKIWSPENRYQKWLDVEIYASEAMVKLGKVPESAINTVKEKAVINMARIDEIERITKHDVISFLTSITEVVGEDGRFLHMGMTSSDVLDTSFAVILKEAADILLADIDELLVVLKK